MTFLRNFALFWYDFIVGDDWTIAVAVVVTLIVTTLLIRSGLDVWWLLPFSLMLTGAANIAFPAISSLIAGAATDTGRARSFTLVYTVAPAISTVVMPAARAFSAVG